MSAWVALVLIFGILGHSLFKMAQERRMAKDIRATLVSETSRIPATVLNRVEYVSFGKYSAMPAHVTGFRDLTLEEIRRLEAEVRSATGDASIVLIISRLDKALVSPNGPFRYGWMLGRLGSDELRERIRPIREELMTIFRSDEDYERVSTNVNHLDDRFRFLLEIAGSEVYPQSRVDALQVQLERKFSEPMDLYAWSRVETVHGPSGQLSMRELNQYFSSRQKENLPDDIQILPGAPGR